MGSRIFIAESGKDPDKPECVGYPVTLEESISMKPPLALIP